MVYSGAQTLQLHTVFRPICNWYTPALKHYNYIPYSRPVIYTTGTLRRSNTTIIYHIPSYMQLVHSGAQTLQLYTVFPSCHIYNWYTPAPKHYNYMPYSRPVIYTTGTLRRSNNTIIYRILVLYTTMSCSTI